ncbi:hypothetical protein OAZ24_00090 [Synechococcus sp. AH-736-G21]|nr:hypothetical protein [Synechococcus sp. AH-736-G21]
MNHAQTSELGRLSIGKGGLPLWPLKPCLRSDTSSSFNVTAEAWPPIQQHSNSTYPFQAKSLGSKRKKPIEVFVSAGSFSNPYYTFKTKKKTIEDLEINRSKRYRFRRAYKASTHPFYISDQGWNQPATRQIKLKGNGDYKTDLSTQKHSP